MTDDGMAGQPLDIHSLVDEFVLTDSDGQHYIIGVGATVDDVQAGEQWVSTQDPVEVEP